MKQKRNRFSKALQHLDLFKESMTFSVDGDSAFGTNSGSLISLLIMSFTIFYGLRKFQVMYKRQDSLQQAFVEKDAIEQGAINLSEAGYNFGAIIPTKLLKYIDPGTNQTVQPDFEDVFAIHAQVLRLESNFQVTIKDEL